MFDRRKQACTTLCFSEFKNLRDGCFKDVPSVMLDLGTPKRKHHSYLWVPSIPYLDNTIGITTDEMVGVTKISASIPRIDLCVGGHPAAEMHIWHSAKSTTPVVEYINLLVEMVHLLAHSEKIYGMSPFHLPRR